MRKRFIVEITYDIECETIDQGKQYVAKILNMIGIKRCSIKHVANKRTDAQNRALHLWFTQITESLNDAGYDIKKTLARAKELPWTPERFKDLYWRPIQKHMTGKKSTTKLTTDEIDRVFVVVSKIIAEDTHIYVPFPSVDSLMERDGY